MSESPGSNPFASPEEAIVEEYSAEAPNKERLVRWVGLSSLSGALLYATYLTPGTALFYLILILVHSPDPFRTLVTQYVPIAVACVVTALYGLLVGGVIGLVHGLTGFACRWKDALLWRLAIWGVLGGLLVAIMPPVLYLLSLEGTSWEALLWMAILLLGAIIAGWRLNVNIHRYLLVPLWEDIPNAEL